MATITAVELRQRVAEELTVASPDQELAADVAARIDTSIGDTRAYLKEEGLCWWPADAIPQAVVIALVWVVAAMACTKFGKAGQGYEAGDARGRARLADLKPSADISTVRASYF
jgi:hypothetical protein